MSIYKSLALAGLLAAAGCGKAVEHPAPAAPAAPVPAVVAVLASSEVDDGEAAVGAAEPLTRVSPGTKLMGRVDRIALREGDRVGAGQVLAVLDARDLDAAIGQARAGVAMAEAQYENAKAMHRRMTELSSRGSATAKNLEDATAGYRAAEAGVAQAKANLTAAEVMRGYAEIRSPIAGVVTARRIEAGDMAAPGMPLFTVEDTSRIKVVVRVPERAVVGLTKGTPASVRIDVLGEDRPAIVDRVLPAGDPMSRTFDVQLLLDNRDGRIQSGMYARARFSRATRKALLVPKDAIVHRGELAGLFIVGDDGTARLRWIRTGGEHGNALELLSGAAEGERYVATPGPTLADGTPVSVTAASAAAVR